MIPYQPMTYIGKPYASSGHSNRPAKHAFRRETDESRAWTSNGAFPHFVWFEFEENKTLTKIGFSSDRRKNWAPKKFEVLASMQCERWEQFDATAEVLLVVENAVFDEADQAKAWWIPKAKQAPYLCIGIKIHSSNRNSLPNTALQNMIMWERRNVRS